MAINFKHSTTGLIKECPEGFSWTTMFFGSLVSLVRGMWIQTLVMCFTFHFATLYYMFTINKQYAAHLLEKGFVPANDIDKHKLVSLGLIAPQIENHKLSA